jgi:hypothetical protein
MKRHGGGLAEFGLMLATASAIVVAAILLAERIFVKSLDAKEVAMQSATAERLAEEGTLYVQRGPLPESDPFAAAWDEVPAMAVPVTPQGVTMPALETASVDQVHVQALTDGRMILWRLTWLDPAPDMNVDSGRFTDAVAVQFPLAPNASYMMGEKEKAVQILHWKGAWQKDVDEHFQDVQDLHPNYWTDLYWFAQGKFPYPVPEAFADTTSHLWFPAYRAGNPMADFLRAQPVEELFAEGFGSLTPQSESATGARGAWRDGRWAVVFARPLQTDDPLDYQFSNGSRGSFSVAVWEGSAGNVGGRKHWSLWVEFLVAAGSVFA